MQKKKINLISLLLVALLGAFVVWYILDQIGLYSDESDQLANRSFQENFLARKKLVYYQKLMPLCQDKSDLVCCQNSVRTMKNGGYRIKAGTSCPTGYSASQLKCPGSLVWCELRPSASNQ
jgi:hypothetical protein